MATNAAGAMRCTCGYLFDRSAGTDESAVTPERVAHEEKLFEEYLEARVAQAIEAASVATHAAELEPENDRKAAEASRRKQVAEAAKAELAAQRVRAAHAADAARSEGSTMKPPAPRQRAKTAKPSPYKGSVHGLEATEATSDDTLYQEYLAVRAAQATKLAQTKDTAASQTAVVQSKTPGKAFRETQAANATKVMQVAASEKTMHCAWCNRKISARAEPCVCGWSHTTRLHAMVSSVDMKATLFDKTCPQCCAILSLAARQCACGHVFESRSPEESQLVLERIIEQEKTEEERFVSGTVSAPPEARAQAQARQRKDRAHPYITEPRAKGSSVSTRDQEVYRGYLQARAGQDAETAGAAAQAAALERGNATRLKKISRARRAAKAAKAGLNAQRLRIVRVAQGAKTGRAKRIAKAWRAAMATRAAKVAKTMLVVAAQTAIGVVRATQNTRRKKPIPVLKRVAERGLYERAVSQAIENAHAARTKRSEATFTGAQAISRRGHTTRSARGSTVSRATQTADRQRQATPPVQVTDSQEHKRSSYADTAFRAAKAAKIARAVEAARALASEKAPEPVVEVVELEATMECPLCTTLLPANASQCNCGWLVPAAQREIPALPTMAERDPNEVGALDCPMECPSCTATIPAGASRCGCGWLVPKREREMPLLVLSADERAAIEQGVEIKRSS